MEKRQLKQKRRHQHYADRIKGVKSTSRRTNNEDNISQTHKKAREWISGQSKEITVLNTISTIPKPEFKSFNK